MEETDKGWLMIRIGEWVNVSSGCYGGAAGESSSIGDCSACGRCYCVL